MSKKSKNYGAIGSAIFHLLLLLLLIIFGLNSIPQEEEGILVNFGDTVMGSGDIEPERSEPQKTEETTPPTPTPPPASSSPEEDQTVTQDYDEAPVVKSEAEKRKEKEESERLEKERMEREVQRQKELVEQAKIRKEQEAKRLKEEEEKRIRDEQQRQTQEAQNNAKNAFSGKSTGNSSSEGNTSGSGNQGSLTGDPNSKNRTGSGLGNSGSGFDLTGRNLVGGFPKPNNNSNEYGIIVIEITVDKNGNVVSAVPILRGSTTNNSYLRQQAITAAKKAKFNVDKNAAAYQKGTITYHFELE